MARRSKPSASPDVLDEFESLGERFAEWVRIHARAVGTAVALSLLLAAVYGGYRSWSSRRELAASAALAAVRGEYLMALGAAPDAFDLPELANPEAAKQIQAEYAGRFREVAEEHAGTTAAWLAWLEAADALAARGEPDRAIDTLRPILAGLSGNPGLRAIAFERIGRWHEEVGRWADAAEAYRSAGEIPDFAPRYWALADAARCFARAGEPELALALFDRIEAEAPQLSLPAHLRSLMRELRSARGSG